VARKYCERVHSKHHVGTTTTATARWTWHFAPLSMAQRHLLEAVGVTSPAIWSVLVSTPRRSCSPRRAPLIFHDARVTCRRHDRGWTVRRGRTRSPAPRRGQVLNRRGAWSLPVTARALIDGASRRGAAVAGQRSLPLPPRPESRRGCLRRSLVRRDPWERSHATPQQLFVVPAGMGLRVLLKCVSCLVSSGSKTRFSNSSRLSWSVGTSIEESRG
jgi:hypothetical protein